MSTAPSIVEVRTGQLRLGRTYVVGRFSHQVMAKAFALPGEEEAVREGVRMLAQGRLDAGRELRASYDDILDPDAVVWIGSGWMPLAVEALDALREAEATVRVVREHCAGLQILARPQDRTNMMYGRTGQAVNLAWERSRLTCEVCGEMGSPRVPGPGVRCDLHAGVL